MIKKSTAYLFKFFVLVLLLCGGSVYAQKGNKAEHAEELFAYWEQGLENARQSLCVSKEDFSWFSRFYGTKLDTLRAIYVRERGTKDLNLLQRNHILEQTEDRVRALYALFKETEKAYPSSVAEYKAPNRFDRIQSVCDTTGCTNIGFEQGTLNGWNAYYGFNNNNGNFNYFNVTNITGGQVGAVTEAANDILTSTNGFYNVGIGPNPNPDYQVSITSGIRSDALTGVIPVVSPFGGVYSVMLGDSTGLNYGVAILSKTFIVKPTNVDFTYQYAVVLENPGSHSFYEQPFFQVALIDGNGDTIHICGQYSVVSSGGKAAGFTPVFVPPNGAGGNDTAYYKDWTIVSVPLKKYLGQCVTLLFEAGDCSKAGHFGYAYVDATCSPFEINASSPGLCGQKSITLKGPPGFTKYTWSGPAGGIIGSNSTQSISIDSAGTYQLIVIPVTGATCSDTLSIHIFDTTGPPPVPSFITNKICQGLPLQFTNTSTPLNGNGVKYYWDFYNLGIFQDSTLNPTWSFNKPGLYDVKLYEIKNGCGADTVIPVEVYPAPEGIINGPKIVCLGDSADLKLDITSSYSSLSYFHWSTGSRSISTVIYPKLDDTSYYVTVTSGCTDTLFYQLRVVTTKPMFVCCDTTIRAGDTVKLEATGEHSYMWTPPVWLGCDTCHGTIAYPRENVTYYVLGVDSNGCRFNDTVRIKVLNCEDIFVPNAFTPNHDGKNDLFGPVGRCMSSYTMTIFDRWGNLLYSTNNSIPWDGTFRGKKVEEDTYVYSMVVTTWDLYEHTVLGSVTVLK